MKGYPMKKYIIFTLTLMCAAPVMHAATTGRQDEKQESLGIQRARKRVSDAQGAIASADANLRRATPATRERRQKELENAHVNLRQAQSALENYVRHNQH